MLNAISYVRVSTQNQNDHGDSLNAQRKQNEAFCRSAGLVIKRQFTDVGTARNEENGSDRPEFKRALELALEKQWPIVVATADRFTRTVPVFEDFLRRGGQMIVASEGLTANEAVLRGRITAAQIKGDFIARRTRIGQQEALRKGKKLGNPKIEEARKSAQIVRSRNAQIQIDEFARCFDQERARGAKSDREMAEAFNKRGHVTASGKPWTHENVRRMRNAREERCEAKESCLESAG